MTALLEVCLRGWRGRVVFRGEGNPRAEGLVRRRGLLRTGLGFGARGDRQVTTRQIDKLGYLQKHSRACRLPIGTWDAWIGGGGILFE